MFFYFWAHQHKAASLIATAPYSVTIAFPLICSISI